MVRARHHLEAAGRHLGWRHRGPAGDHRTGRPGQRLRDLLPAHRRPQTGRADQGLESVGYGVLPGDRPARLSDGPRRRGCWRKPPPFYRLRPALSGAHLARPCRPRYGAVCHRAVGQRGCDGGGGGRARPPDRVGRQAQPGRDGRDASGHLPHRILPLGRLSGLVGVGLHRVVVHRRAPPALGAGRPGGSRGVHDQVLLRHRGGRPAGRGVGGPVGE